MCADASWLLFFFAKQPFVMWHQPTFKEYEIAQASKCSHENSLFVIGQERRSSLFIFMSGTDAFHRRFLSYCLMLILWPPYPFSNFLLTLSFFPVSLARLSFVKWYISPNYSSFPSHPGCTYNHQHAAADPAASAPAVPGTADEAAAAAAAASLSFLLLFFLGWSASSRWPCLQ